MAETIELEIVTPERLVVNTAPKKCRFRAATAISGILPGHAPLITELAVGEIVYVNAGVSTPAPPLPAFACAAIIPCPRRGSWADRACSPPSSSLWLVRAAPLPRKRPRLGHRPSMSLAPRSCSLPRHRSSPDRAHPNTKAERHTTRLLRLSFFFDMRTPSRPGPRRARLYRLAKRSVARAHYRREV